MARLTYQDADGSWGLHGVSWDQLAALPPRVYGALVRLRDLEARMEAETGDAPAEMEPISAQAESSMAVFFRITCI